MNTIPSIDELFPVKVRTTVSIPDVSHIDGVAIIRPMTGMKAAFMGISCGRVDNDATCSRVVAMGGNCYRVWFDHDSKSFVVICA